MAHPYQTAKQELKVGDKTYNFFSLPSLNDERVAKLPFSIRVLLESNIRNCDEFAITKADVEKILDWENSSQNSIEIPFKPARVILQDFTGVPAVVDLAAMRDAMKRLGGDPNKINPLVPVDLVVDHSVQVDVSASPSALEENEKKEFERNFERFVFLKWGADAFENLQIVPPGSGIVHQVNLEYLARSVFNDNGLLYPDSLVGTDSHTTMINGVGCVGWGVGGIEAEAVMLGQPISMVLPKVIGYKFTGTLPDQATATDLVLTVVQNLRKKGVVGKFVEFFGPGVQTLSLADRATISNMGPEYGATMGYFPVDSVTMEYLKQTGRSEEQCAWIENYLRAQGLFRVYDGSQADPVYTDILELDLSTVVPCLSGPKRPHDRIALSDMKSDFKDCLTNKVGFKGFAVPAEEHDRSVEVTVKGKTGTLKHGSVVIAAITSCTNTSNPGVILGSALLAKNAVEAGLSVSPLVKTSLAPGSGVVTKYLEASGLVPYLEQLGFHTVGYGCTTCIGNSGPLDPALVKAIEDNKIISAGVLSGNRNFEGRIHQNVPANYLASPPLVVAYALAGTVQIDFDKEPIGQGKDGKDVFLRDIWPSRDLIAQTISKAVQSSMFKEVYGGIKTANKQWNALDAPSGTLYPWDEKSTYIHDPPFFKSMGAEPGKIAGISGACVLANFGDSITTDHISPAGAIARNSPAARYLTERGVETAKFNTYGSRRGNDEVMARGTFANIRLINKFIGKAAPKTVHHPSGETLDIFDAAARYQSENTPLIILAGAEYGSGSSRDWAAKGPYLQGVKAVIAVSYERIHRSNLVGMGIVPLQFKAGESADSLGLTGKEKYSIDLPEQLTPGQDINVTVEGGKTFTVTLRFDTEVELQYFGHGGILQFVLRKLLK
eukprot:TRINITY_DN431_c0_g1_i2.p1 TRINITY_DN431_c0_g1~~TRINITY_DN431_c0_g1_i2.p1  ORF type:complete len:890 (-),score=353.27 TRINITY_DN431_c0_g1_i2:173-2842(-)